MHDLATRSIADFSFQLTLEGSRTENKIKVFSDLKLKHLLSSVFAVNNLRIMLSSIRFPS